MQNNTLVDSCTGSWKIIQKPTYSERSDKKNCGRNYQQQKKQVGKAQR